MYRHELDVTSLIAGILFAGLGAAFLFDRTDLVDVDVRWVWPILLIGLGIAGLATARRPPAP